MKTYAVTVYVEAEDVLGAVEVAGDIFANMQGAREMAAAGELKVRPARAGEVPS